MVLGLAYERAEARATYKQAASAIQLAYLHSIE